MTIDHAELKRLAEAVTPGNLAGVSPQTILTILAEREADKRRIAELEAGENYVRTVLVEVFAHCIRGIADAAIIRQQTYTIEHVVSGMAQLADYAKKLEHALSLTPGLNDNVNLPSIPKTPEGKP